MSGDICPKCRRVLDVEKIKGMDGDIAECAGCGEALLIGDWERISGALDLLVEAGIPAALELRAELDKNGVGKAQPGEGGKVVIAISDLGPLS